MAVAALLKRQAEADRRRHRRGDHQHLPLRHLPAGPRGDPRRGERVREEHHEFRSQNRIAAPSSSAPPPPAAGSRSASTSVRPERRSRAADGSPEVNAWVVIKPDDTVVIRIARSEMGQGTLTGLAQLVAEELECDWSKVTTEYPTPGREPRAQARLGRFRHRRQPRHPRLAGIRPPGRRRGAHDADPGGGRRVEGAGVGVHARRTASITHKASGTHDDLRQGRGGRGQARAAEGHQAQGPEGLEDRRQAAEAARHRRQGRPAS